MRPLLPAAAIDRCYLQVPPAVDRLQGHMSFMVARRVISSFQIAADVILVTLD
jgi:hypothetical protein